LVVLIHTELQMHGQPHIGCNRMSHVTKICIFIAHLETDCIGMVYSFLLAHLP